MDPLRIFYVPCPSEEEAERLVRLLLDGRLIACGNIVESKSIYEWDGSIQTEEEWIAIMKTESGLANEIEKTIADIHSYDTPAIISYEVQANQSYLDWVKEQVKREK